MSVKLVRTSFNQLESEEIVFSIFGHQIQVIGKKAERLGMTQSINDLFWQQKFWFLQLFKATIISLFYFSKKVYNQLFTGFDLILTSSIKTGKDNERRFLETNPTKL